MFWKDVFCPCSVLSGDSLSALCLKWQKKVHIRIFSSPVDHFYLVNLNIYLGL